MLAILIIGLLVLALIVVMGSRGDAELERDQFRIELEGRKCAEEAGKPFGRALQVNDSGEAAGVFAGAGI